MSGGISFYWSGCVLGLPDGDGDPYGVDQAITMDSFKLEVR